MRPSMRIFPPCMGMWQHAVPILCPIGPLAGHCAASSASTARPSQALLHEDEGSPARATLDAQQASDTSISFTPARRRRCTSRGGKSLGRQVP